jgi:hypothetical protein
LTEWRLFLGSYNYQVLYKPAKDNLCADALSRFIDQETKEIQDKPGPRQKSLSGRKRDTRRPSSPLINLKLSKSSIIFNDSTQSDSESDSTSVSIIQFCCDQLQPHSHPILAVTRGEARKEAENFIERDNEENIVVSLSPELGADEPSSQPNHNYFQNLPPEYVIDPDRQSAIIKEYHGSAFGSHQGSKRTYDRLKPLFKWPRMLHTIDEYNKP